jgi:Protein of unknown function (DUF3040)
VELSGGERARLGRIEAALAAADPGLVARFRRWQPADGSGSAPSGWSRAHTWMLAVFLVAFCTWTLAPFVGWLVAAVVAGCWLRERRAARGRAGRLAEGDTGGHRSTDRR